MILVLIDNYNNLIAKLIKNILSHGNGTRTKSKVRLNDICVLKVHCEKGNLTSANFSL